MSDGFSRLDRKGAPSRSSPGLQSRGSIRSPDVSSGRRTPVPNFSRPYRGIRGRPGYDRPISSRESASSPAGPSTPAHPTHGQIGWVSYPSGGNPQSRMHRSRDRSVSLSSDDLAAFPKPPTWSPQQASSTRPSHRRYASDAVGGRELEGGDSVSGRLEGRISRACDRRKPPAFRQTNRASPETAVSYRSSLETMESIEEELRDLDDLQDASEEGHDENTSFEDDLASSPDEYGLGAMSPSISASALASAPSSSHPRSEVMHPPSCACVACQAKRLGHQLDAVDLRGLQQTRKATPDEGPDEEEWIPVSPERHGARCEKKGGWVTRLKRKTSLRRMLKEPDPKSDADKKGKRAEGGGWKGWRGKSAKE